MSSGGGMSYRPSTRRTEAGVAVALRSIRRAIDPGEVFMIQRTGAHGEGTWSIPGGWIEPGEEPERAAIREVWEEVGVIVGKGDLSFLGYTADKHPEGVHGITLWFEAFEWQGNPRNTNPDRIAETRWWPLAGLYDGHVPGPLFTPLANGLQKRLLKATQ